MKYPADITDSASVAEPLDMSFDCEETTGSGHDLRRRSSGGARARRRSRGHRGFFPCLDQLSGRPGHRNSGIVENPRRSGSVWLRKDMTFRFIQDSTRGSGGQ